MVFSLILSLVFSFMVWGFPSCPETPSLSTEDGSGSLGGSHFGTRKAKAQGFWSGGEPQSRGEGRKAYTKAEKRPCAEGWWTTAREREESLLLARVVE